VLLCHWKESRSHHVNADLPLLLELTCSGQKQGNLPETATGWTSGLRVPGLKLLLHAKASQIPRDPQDVRILNQTEVADSTDVIAFSRNVSWTRQDADGVLGLFTEDGPNQLFANAGPANFTVSVNGSWHFQLASHRHGIVLLSTHLQGPGDRYFSCRTAPNNSTQAQNFLFLVRPVNDQPSFRLTSVASAEIETTEDAGLFIEQFALNVSKGGWSEEDQKVTFTLVRTGGDSNLFDRAFVECVDGSNGECTSGIARLRLVPTPDMWGSVTYSLKITDSGGTDRGGIDTFPSAIEAPITFSVKIWPKNDVPSFMLSAAQVIVGQDTTCEASSLASWTSPLSQPSCRHLANPTQNLTHEHNGFATAISMGAYEDGPLPGGGPGQLSVQGVCSSGPCEHQSGIFTVEPLDPVQAGVLFKTLPRVTATGTLQFEARWLMNGESTFRISLRDSGTIDMTVVPGVKMDPSMTFYLPETERCTLLHSASFCQAARDHDQARLDLIATLQGDDALTSPQALFTIQIVPVNRAPSFTLPDRIEVLEDSGMFSHQVVSNITSDNTTFNTEPGQNVTFSVATNYSQLFADGGEPTISRNGVLEFTTAADAFGPVELHVTLTDDGDSENGGRNYSDTLILLLVVNALNDAPLFASDVRNVEVSENTATQSISMFTTYLLAGPANEMCQNPGPYCMKQKMVFRVLDIDNPTLFAVQPQVSVDDNYLTRLIFDVTPGATGTAKITYLFEDDGRSAESLPLNVLSTVTSTFRVKVFATNDPPSFQLPFSVSSLTCAADMPSSSLCPRHQHADSQCYCSQIAPSTKCQAVEDVIEDDSNLCRGARVELAQSYTGQRSYVVRGFAADVTPAYGYQPSALTLFMPERTHVDATAYHDAFTVRPHQDAQYANVHAQGHAPDPLAPVDSLQLAVDTAVSPDGKHLYAVEAETNSVSLYLLSADGPPCFIDRRSHGERRLRFQRPVNAVETTVTVPTTTAQVTNASCLFSDVLSNISNLTNSSHHQVPWNVTVGPFGVRFVNGSWFNCTNASHSLHAPAIQLKTTFACGIEAFQSHSGLDTFVAVASGCQSLADLSSKHRPPKPCASEMLTAECGYDCCMSIESSTVGLWDFTEHSISGKSRRLNTFQGQHTFKCYETNCSYSRPRNGHPCSEVHDTWYSWAHASAFAHSHSHTVVRHRAWSAH